jgi:stage II sporulation protein D
MRSARFEIVESGDHFTFLGSGAGHGVGLCQHGTLARAEDGQDYLDILEAYFPGTVVGTR